MGLRQRRQKPNTLSESRFVGTRCSLGTHGPHSERLLSCPCPSRHRTPRLCFSFSPHLRSFISNSRHYRHFSPDGQHSPLVAPKPYADHPARRPSSPARPASHRLHFQLHIARVTPSRSPVESQCQNPSPLGRVFYCLPYRAPFVRFPSSFHHRPSALYSTVCLFYLSPESRVPNVATRPPFPLLVRSILVYNPLASPRRRGIEPHVN